MTPEAGRDRSTIVTDAPRGGQMAGERCADDSGACDDDGRASGHGSTYWKWGRCECIYMLSQDRTKP